MGVFPTLLIGILSGLLGATLARKRQRNPYTWFFIGFFFGLIGICVLFFLPKKQPPQEPTTITPPPQEEPIWYYLNEKHEIQGPITPSELQNLYHQGTLTTTSYLWKESLPEWTQAEALAGALPLHPGKGA